MVEGVFLDNVKNVRYIRVIEAISDGVVRSVIDCKRFSERGGTLLYVEGLTESQRNSIIQYMISKLGDEYQLNAYTDCDNRVKWQCSQLAYCSYQQIGINIHGSTLYPGIAPFDIHHSDNTIIRTVNTYSVIPPTISKIYYDYDWLTVRVTNNNTETSELFIKISDGNWISLGFISSNSFIDKTFTGLNSGTLYTFYAYSQYQNKSSKTISDLYYTKVACGTKCIEEPLYLNNILGE